MEGSDDDARGEFQELQRRGTSILSHIIPFEKSPMRFFNEEFKAGSVKGSIATLIVSIVGAGTLSVPYAVQQSGLFFGIFLFALGAFMAAFTLNIIAVSSQITGLKSYEKIAKKLYGKTAANIAITALTLNLYGTIISYIVGSSHTLTYVLNSFLTTPIDTQVVTVVLLVFVIFPLSLLKTMSALRYSSLVAVMCVIYLSITVLLKYFQFCLDKVVVSLPIDQHHNITETVTCFWEKQNEKIILFNYDHPVKVLGALPIVVYAYTCHPSLLPILLELNRPDLSRMKRVSNYSNLISLIIYVVIGGFVYLTFKTENEYSHGNFLFNDFKKDGAVLLGALGMAVSLAFGVPLFVSSFRNIMTPIITFYFDYDTFLKIKADAKIQSRKSALTEVLLDSENSAEVSQTPYVNMFWHTVISFLLLFFAGLPAILVNDISNVFTILGGTTNPILCFIFPTLFILKLGGPEYFWTKVVSIIITITMPTLCLVSMYLQMRNW